MESIVRALKRKGLRLRANRNTRREREKLLAVASRVATVITIAMAAAMFSREFLIALPLLIALGVTALDLIESHQINLKALPC